MPGPSLSCPLSPTSPPWAAFQRWREEATRSLRGSLCSGEGPWCWGGGVEESGAHPGSLLSGLSTARSFPTVRLCAGQGAAPLAGFSQLPDPRGHVGRTPRVPESRITVVSSVFTLVSSQVFFQH